MNKQFSLKICGITNEADLMNLLRYPVGYLGFIVTDREIASRIPVEYAVALMKKVPPTIQKVVGVGRFPMKRIAEIARMTGADIIQLQRNGTPAEIRWLRGELPRIQIWRAVHTDEEQDISAILELEQAADAILLHTKPSEWKQAEKIAGQLKKPFILAGALDAKNITAAVSTFHPAVIDLIRGVETIPGKKDFQKVEELIGLL